MLSAAIRTAAAGSRLRRCILVLGWTVAGLWGVLAVGAALPLETTSSGLSASILLVLTALTWSLPITLSLHLTVWLRSEALLIVILRIVLVGICLLLTFLILYASLFMLGAVNFSRKQPWQDERVLYVQPGRPAARVAVQGGQDPTGNPIQRVVQLTPVLGLWQLVEPVDTTRFDATGWVRVPQ